MRFKKEITGNILKFIDIETNTVKASFSLSALTGLKDILGEAEAKKAIRTIVESYYADLTEEELQEIIL